MLALVAIVHVLTNYAIIIIMQSDWYDGLFRHNYTSNKKIS